MSGKLKRWLILAAFATGACVNAAERIVLAEFPAGGKLHFELSAAPCASAKKDEKNGTCRVQVRLLEEKNLLETHNLEWEATSGSKGKLDVTKSTDESPRHRSKPKWVLAPPQDDGYFDEGELAVYCESLDVAPGVRGILVTEEAGFEHTHRRHVIFVAVDGRLIAAWNGGDKIGASVTWLAPAQMEDHTPRAVYFYVSYSGEDEDDFEVSALRWDPKKGVLQEAKQDSQYPPVFAAIAGSDKTVAESRKTREKLNACEAAQGFIVVSTKAIPRLTKGLFIVAAFSVDERELKKQVEAMKRCQPPIDAYVKRAF